MVAPPPIPRTLTETHRALIKPIEEVIRKQGPCTMQELHKLATPLAGATPTRPISFSTVRMTVNYLCSGNMLKQEKTDRGVVYSLDPAGTQELDLRELPHEGIKKVTFLRMGGAYSLRVEGTNKRYVHVAFRAGVSVTDRSEQVRLLKAAQQMLKSSVTSSPVVAASVIEPKDNGMDPIALRDARIAERARVRGAR